MRDRALRLPAAAGQLGLQGAHLLILQLPRQAVGHLAQKLLPALVCQFA